MMKAIYHIRHKGKIAFLLLFLILIELHKNALYQNDISKMGDSFSEVYADRLLVQDYILRFTNTIHQRKSLVTEYAGDIRFSLTRQNADLKILIAKYEKTRLTDQERIIFNHVKSKLSVMQLLEQKMLDTGSNLVKHEMLVAYTDKAGDLLNELQVLSGIQIAEGNRLNETSKAIVLNSEILSQFAWGLIIIIGLSMMVIVFANKAVIPKIRQNQFLN